MSKLNCAEYKKGRNMVSGIIYVAVVLFTMMAFIFTTLGMCNAYALSETTVLQASDINDNGASFDELALTVSDDSVPEVVGPVYCNGEKTAFKLTAKNDNTLSEITHLNGDTIQELSSKVITTNFVVDSSITGFLVRDDRGLSTKVTDFTIDSNAPTAKITRADNICTITATDNESGLWKIEQIGADESVVATTYFDKLYATKKDTTKSITLDSRTIKVKVYDSVNNARTLQIPALIVFDGAKTISQDELNGIKVVADCILTFEGETPIQIGHSSKANAGIEVINNVTLTIINNNTSREGVSIYGGKGVDLYGSEIKYAGIYIPTSSTLNIQQSEENDIVGITNVYGHGGENGTGAGIGGNGITVANVASSLALTDSGIINISGGKVYAYGGYNENGKVYGTGAGIGGGGIYNTKETNLNGGELARIIISDGNVTAYGGYSNDEAYGTGAGIGGGGVWDNKAIKLVGGNTLVIAILDKANVDAKGGYATKADIYGTGAGIGGGGVYHKTSQATITGGDISESVIMSGTGEICAIGGYCDSYHEAYGTGAGIGGGGVYSTAGNNVTGGSTNIATFTGKQNITVKGGYGSSKSCGLGAARGGGGVCTTNIPKLQSAGELSNLVFDTNTNISILSTESGYGQGADVGNGGRYIGTSSIDGAEYDEEGPQVLGYTYSQGNVTIVAKDNGTNPIGLWKISKTTDPSQTAYDAYTYNPSTPPTTTTTADPITCINVSNYYVFDRLGNYDTVSIEKTIPTVAKACRKGTNAIVTATDSGTGRSGLWKVVESNSPTAPQCTSGIFQATADTEELFCTLSSTDVSSIYVVDHAGNVSASKSVTEDTAAPTATIETRLVDGKATVTATDSDSGLYYIEQLDPSGTPLATTFFDTLYTTTSNTQKIIDLDANAVTIKVYDALGNATNPIQIPPLTLEGTGTKQISTSQINGIKVTGDCTVQFESGATAIQIGHTTKPWAGIEIASSSVIVTNNRSGGVNIYGGSGTDSYGSTVKYAGIYVPSSNSLTINGSGTMTATGYGSGHGTGAGIGGNGVMVSNASSVNQTSAGAITISAGTVTANGGSITSGDYYATGAGIGGGGLYNTSISSVTGGANLSSITIQGSANITANGGNNSSGYIYGGGAGIGGGGMYNSVSTDITGGSLGTITINGGTISSAIGGSTTGSTHNYGTGAGIGGGGMYNTNSSVTSQTGGTLTTFDMKAGTITQVKGGGCSSTLYYAYGSGAGIGGGGIYNYNAVTASNITKGTLTNKHIENYGSITTITMGQGNTNCDSAGGNIGGGGLYNGSDLSQSKGHECLIEGNMTISEDIPSGLYIADDATVIFSASVSIGAPTNLSEGIEIAPTKSLTMINENGATPTITINGGNYQEPNNDVYRYAGIYVPVNSSLEIKEDGSNAFTVNATGYGAGNGTGAGIGGNGVTPATTTSNISQIQAGTITISGGRITATGGSADNLTIYGTGAGIGGGGLYTGSLAIATQQGGNLETMIIKGGNITAQGGSVTGDKHIYGTGAGIGGGGLGNAYTSASQTGGTLKVFDMRAGTIAQATGGNCSNTSYSAYGSGAGIGGGGIANSSKVTNPITKGGLIKKHIEDYTQVLATKGVGNTSCTSSGGNIGAGGIYNNGDAATTVKGYECLIDNRVLDNGNATISETVVAGLYIKENATLTFGTTVTLGDATNLSEGIKIAPTKTLTMINSNNNSPTITVHGGQYNYKNLTTDAVEDVYRYAAIHVPTGTTLNIQKATSGALTVTANGNGSGNGTGAGIGGNGITPSKTGSSITELNAGTINISGGVLNANGGYYSGNVNGTGAGIGGGGLYNTVITADRTGGGVTKVDISLGTVNAKAGYSGSGTANGTGAGIGGGGIYNSASGKLTGGVVAEVKTSGGSIVAWGGRAESAQNANGTGAGIGGGGIYNEGATDVTGGAITKATLQGGAITANGGYINGASVACGTGAGIGGGGIWDNATTTNLAGGDVGEVSVSGSTSITAKGGYTGAQAIYGTGAGIGGGGIYHETSTSTIVGGSVVTKVEMSGTGAVTSYGGYNTGSYTAYGTGAGIGSGGIYATATTKGSSVTGGNVELAKFTGSQTVTAYGGYGYAVEASGAGIGGGGVHNNAGTTVAGGTLDSVETSAGTVKGYGGYASSSTATALGAGIGGGGVYNTSATSVTAGSATAIDIKGTSTVEGKGVYTTSGNSYALGAGIGCGGVYNDCATTTAISGGAIDTINIETSNTVTAIGGNATGQIYASGAGIGTGGIYNVSSANDATLTGGTVATTACTIKNVSTLTATGGGSTTSASECRALGAGIGGGGIHSTNAATVLGSGLDNITMQSGTVVATGGSSSYTLYGTGAGIGGGGIWDNGATTSLVGGNAGTVGISGSANVTAKGGYTAGYAIYGTGAGIGGGGIHHQTSSVDITGGSLDGITIGGTGTIAIYGGYNTGGNWAHGLGAGIGGGGINATSGSDITGGNLSLATLQWSGSQTPTVEGGRGHGVRGSGAAIGGGGISNTGATGDILAGGITTGVTVSATGTGKMTASGGYATSTNSSYYSEGTGAGIGSGGIYNTATCASIDGGLVESVQVTAGKLDAFGGRGYNSSAYYVYGSGAGIGGGGIYNDNGTEDITGESIKTVTLSGGTTKAYGGYVNGAHEARGLGAGIGGGGIWDNKATSLVGGSAQTVGISGTASVEAKGGYTGNATIEGLGAGIGGGGIYHTTTAADITGGNLESVTIGGTGTVSIYGGYSEGTANGTGAGIGGGGICATSGGDITGGNLEEATLQWAGTQAITVDGGKGSLVNGSGAGIGGGGIYNSGATGDVVGGEITTGVTISGTGTGALNVSGGYSTGNTACGTGAGIGGGGIVNSVDTSSLTGGRATSVEVTQGTVNAKGGYANGAYQVSGTGAGIGGGGIYNTGTTAVTGGVLEEAILRGGTINAYGGYVKEVNTAQATGAGIGGGGVYHNKATAITGGHANEVSISNGAIVTAEGGYTKGTLQGSGAGIGGGGIYTQTAGSTITGGGIDGSATANIAISGTGNVNATGGYSTSSSASYLTSGTGAGIGGGGIYAASGTSITGGKTKDATFNGTQTITAQGGYGYGTSGSGAGIGGGGIYNSANATVTGGKLTNIEVNSGIINADGGYSNGNATYGSGAGIGGGGIYNSANATSQTGGNLDTITLIGGTITAKGGYVKGNYDISGTGAGIGGGGIYNTYAIPNATLNSQIGGTLDTFDIQNDTVTVVATGGNLFNANNNTYKAKGTGAGIGGGGIANQNKVLAQITKGGLTRKHIEDYLDVVATKGTGVSGDITGYSGGNIGQGGLYNAGDSDTSSQGYECRIVGDYIVNETIPSGLYIEQDTILTINGTMGIGAQNNLSEGIKVAPSRTLTIINASGEESNVTINGGMYTYDNNDVYRYAGIYLPSNATLNIGEANTGSLTITSTGHGEGNGTGAGIGGNGISTGTESSAVAQTNTGTMSITGGTVIATGGSITTGDYAATGAGIGGGGLYNDKVASVTGGANLQSITISGNSDVTAKGGYSAATLDATGAGIGGGGIYNEASTTLSGGKVTTVALSAGDITATGGYVSGTGTIRGTGAGIGGGGVYDNTATTLNGGHVETISISGTAEIEAKGGYTQGIIRGSGAGIGGGGVCHETSNATITGGSIITSITMTGTGDVETTGGYSTSSDTTYIAFGLGAGIGGGGTYSSNGDSVTGGKIASATFSGAQLITSLGGYGFDTRGSGAGIGGGGLCITNSPSTLNVGELESLAVNTNANKRTLLTAVAETLYGQGAEVGNGGLYRQATRENGAEYDDLPPVIISNLYSGEKVTVTAQDSNIGLWKISTSTDPRGPIEDDVYIYTDTPKDIVTVEGIDCTSTTYFYVYDRLGNRASAVLAYAYISENGRDMSLAAYDSRGIVKISIVDDRDPNNVKESLLEIFDEPVQKYLKNYKVLPGTTKVRLYINEEEYSTLELEVYTQSPTLIGDEVYSMVGLKQFEYADGTIMVFRNETPVKAKVNLNIHGGLKVYDTLGNVLEVPGIE